MDVRDDIDRLEKDLKELELDDDEVVFIQQELEWLYMVLELQESQK